MSWITNYVKPTLKYILGRDSTNDIPDNTWIKCPKTEMIFHKRDLIKNLYISPYSEHHFRMPVFERMKMLFDNGEYEREYCEVEKDDPIEFKDKKKYIDRITAARKDTGEHDAVVVGFGKIDGNKAVVTALNFDFMAGSMGREVGEGIIKGADLAIKENCPYIVVVCSGGARMQEGVMSLMQMARATVAVENLKEAEIPYIVVLTDPTTGGVSASFAMLGDVHIAETGAMICFAGPRVIEQTVKEKLPEGFQRAEFLYEHGMVDIVCSRKELKKQLSTIIDLTSNKVK